MTILKPKKQKSDALFSEDIQVKVLSKVSGEFSIAARNHAKETEDFNNYYDMLHCVRTNKPNDWESDIALPEFTSRLLTQIGNFTSRYFSSREFIEPDIESDDPKDIAEAKAAKNLINKLLNEADAYYYHKIIRLLMFVFISGHGIIKGGYKQQTKNIISHYSTRSELAINEFGEYIAEDGMPYSDPYGQRPMYNEIKEPIYKKDIIEDRPIFDVYPIQNVYMSPEYSYSLQEKRYVIFETEQTLDELEADKDRLEYFNLHLLEPDESDLGKGTANKDGKNEQDIDAPLPKIIIQERWGKYPVIVKARDAMGKPTEYEPGIDKNGKWIENAENFEVIISRAKKNYDDEPGQLIRFQISPHSKRPMIRFLCYVDPLDDKGFGDGEVNREIQTAIDDNYNLMNYRTKLAITPAFKAKRFSGIGENIRITPEKAILLENLDDLQEFKIEDNIQGGIVHQNLLSSRMDYAMATSPVAMGNESERRETATAAGIQDQRMNIRVGMKSLNMEFIGFTEFYNMILTLCNDFMLPETLEELIGEQAFNYNPKRKDKFKPVSQALETEESKQFKVRMWDQILGKLVQMPNPKTPMVVNYILGQQLELMGGDFKHFKKFMFEENPEANALYQLSTGAKVSMQQSPQGGLPGGGPQNQQGIPQGGQEQMTRMTAGG